MGETTPEASGAQQADQGNGAVAAGVLPNATLQASVPAPVPVTTVEPQPTLTPLPTVTSSGREVWDLWRTWEQQTELSLPFANMAFVSQGWNGRDPTHYGKWRYALDFIVLDKRGRSHRGEGDKLDDYYSWGTEVLTAAPGRVVAVESDIPDNPPYQPRGGEERWGNHVIIDHGYSEYSETSHLQQGSIVVQVGQTVERGQLLGLVGNSGYSYEPHTHFQLQDAPIVGATTLPARFASFYETFRGRVYHRTNRAPGEGDYISNQRQQ